MKSVYAGLGAVILALVVPGQKAEAMPIQASPAMTDAGVVAPTDVQYRRGYRGYGYRGPRYRYVRPYYRGYSGYGPGYGYGYGYPYGYYSPGPYVRLGPFGFGFGF